MKYIMFLFFLLFSLNLFATEFSGGDYVPNSEGVEPPLIAQVLLERVRVCSQVDIDEVNSVIILSDIKYRKEFYPVLYLHHLAEDVFRLEIPASDN